MDLVFFIFYFSSMSFSKRAFFLYFLWLKDFCNKYDMRKKKLLRIMKINYEAIRN